jgi:hypothetical protein
MLPPLLTAIPAFAFSVTSACNDAYRGQLSYQAHQLPRPTTPHLPPHPAATYTTYTPHTFLPLHGNRWFYLDAGGSGERI